MNVTDTRTDKQTDGRTPASAKITTAPVTLRFVITNDCVSMINYSQTVKVKATRSWWTARSWEIAGQVVYRNGLSETYIFLFYWSRLADQRCSVSLWAASRTVVELTSWVVVNIADYKLRQIYHPYCSCRNCEASVEFIRCRRRDRGGNESSEPPIYNVRGIHCKLLFVVGLGTKWTAKKNVRFHRPI